MTAEFSLRDIYLFTHLSDERLAEIESVLETRTLNKGEVIFNMGDPGDEIFMVMEGEVAIYAPDKENVGEEQAIRIFFSGDALGEMALIDHQPRSLSARAQTEATVMVLKDADFRRYVEADIDLAYAVMQGLTDRIRYTTEFLNEVRTWVGRVTDGDYSNDNFISDVETWVNQIAEGDYDQAIEAAGKYKDETLAKLAAEFARMAARVKEREQELQQEIVQLKIQIDDQKRKQEVDRITSSDFFQDLQKKAAEARQKQEGIEETSDD